MTLMNVQINKNMIGENKLSKIKQKVKQIYNYYFSLHIFVPFKKFIPNYLYSVYFVFICYNFVHYHLIIAGCYFSNVNIVVVLFLRQ